MEKNQELNAKDEKRKVMRKLSSWELGGEDLVGGSLLVWWIMSG